MKIGYSMFQPFDSDSMRIKETSKKQHSQLTKSFLGLVLKERHISSMYQLVKSLKVAVSPHYVLQHVKEALPDMCSSLILPNKLPRTNAKLKTT